MRALSIRQPFAELILRGLKTIEYRSRPTRIVGERFYLYASKGKSEFRNPNIERIPKSEIRIPQSAISGISADNIVVPTQTPPPPWMIELANALKLFPHGVLTAGLPTGVIVGTAVIEKVTEGIGGFEWHLGDVERVKTLRKPKGHPQPVWFEPL